MLRNPNRPKPLQLGTLTIDDELAHQVRYVVDAEVNPALAAHGGYVTFVGHDGEGRAYLTMGGGCHGCSMSRMTMLQGRADDDHGTPCRASTRSSTPPITPPARTPTTAEGGPRLRPPRS